jgi:hypothetical protein
MTAKRASPRKQPARAKAKSQPRALAESAVLVILESTPPASGAAAAIDEDRRRQLIAAEAYFLAERRGFVAGHELEDWVAAEATVESRLRDSQAA